MSLSTPSFPCPYTTAQQLLELVREEIKGCTDVPRLHAAAGVLCQLAGGTEPVRSAALRSALILLANRYPKVGLGLMHWPGRGKLKLPPVLSTCLLATHPLRSHMPPLTTTGAALRRGAAVHHAADR